MILFPDPLPTVTSNSKALCIKQFQITRTTAADTVMAELPSDATLVAFIISSPAVSDAGTSASINIGVPGTATRFVNAMNAKTTPAANTPTMVVQSNLGNVLSDTKITAAYSESGTASTAGGPWTVTVLYFR